MNENDQSRKKKTGQIIITAFILLTCLIPFLVTRWATHNPKMVSLAHGELIPRITCTSIVDGVTFNVEFSNGRSETVRLIGVEAPIGSQGRAQDAQANRVIVTRDRLNEQSRVVVRVLEGWVKRRRVALIFPNDDEKRDDEGRLLAYVETHGMDVAKKLLEGGHIMTTGKDHPYADKYEEVQTFAKEQGNGLWRP